ncbi:hypothetical protein MMC25_007838 [Agyrium rufum]|nr:hypothetical protein [Agyrium rufum]
MTIAKYIDQSQGKRRRVQITPADQAAAEAVTEQRTNQATNEAVTSGKSSEQMDIDSANLADNSGIQPGEEVTVRDIKLDVAQGESDNQADVRKLIGFVKKISTVAKPTPGQKLEVQYRYGLGLQLYEQAEGVAIVLPEDRAAK